MIVRSNVLVILTQKRDKSRGLFFFSLLRPILEAPTFPRDFSHGQFCAQRYQHTTAFEFGVMRLFPKRPPAG